MSKRVYFPYEQTLTAGQIVTVYDYHGWFNLLSISGSNTYIEISFDESTFSKFLAGTALKLPEDVHTIKIKNPYAVSVDIFATFTDDVFVDNRLTMTASSINTLSAATAIETPAGLTIPYDDIEEIEGDAGIVSVMLQNNGDYDIWLGDEDVDPTTNRGIKLEPGDVTVLELTASIYAKAVTAASTLSIMRLTS